MLQRLGAASPPLNKKNQTKENMKTVTEKPIIQRKKADSPASIYFTEEQREHYKNLMGFDDDYLDSLPLLDEDLIDSETRYVGDAILLPEVANRLRDSERNMTPQNGVRDFTNRNLRENSKQTGQMVMDIKEGNFFPTLLSFDWNGYIQNAQHRCFAVEQGGDPVIVMVETRANPKAFFSHDCGNPRKFVDNAITGFLQHWRTKDGGYLGKETALKGIMSKICSIGERSMAISSPDTTGRVGSQLSKFNASFPTKERWFEANKDSLIFAVNIWKSSSYKWQGKKIAGVGRLGFLTGIALMHRINPEKAQDFCLDLIQNVNGGFCPAARLRNQLIKNDCEMDGHHERNIEQEQVLYCMGKYLQGKEVRAMSRTVKLKG